MATRMVSPAAMAFWIGELAPTSHALAPFSVTVARTNWSPGMPLFGSVMTLVFWLAPYTVQLAPGLLIALSRMLPEAAGAGVGAGVAVWAKLAVDRIPAAMRPVMM